MADRNYQNIEKHEDQKNFPNERRLRESNSHASANGTWKAELIAPIVAGSVASGIISYGTSNIIVSELNRNGISSKIVAGSVYAILGAACTGVAASCAKAILGSHTSSYLAENQQESGGKER